MVRTGVTLVAVGETMLLGRPNVAPAVGIDVVMVWLASVVHDASLDEVPDDVNDLSKLVTVEDVPLFWLRPC